ncbi:MAG: hypothetical protein WC599_05370 [Bacteroidales bacterium]
MKTNFKRKMIFKSLSALGIICILALLMYSCGSSNSANNTDQKETGSDSVNASTSNSENTNSENTESSVSVTDETPESSDTKSAEKITILSVTETLAKAEKDANSVFLVVTDPNKTDIKKALEIAATANLSVKKSIIVQMDREDKNNNDLVSRYGLSGAPLPVLLVISPKGVLAGGYLLKDATADLLVKLIPSPKQDEVLIALNNKKSVFIVAAKNTFTDKTKAIENCKSAVTLNGNKSELVEINLSDTKEKPFLELLRVNTATTSTATVVVNNKGQIAGTFYEIKDAASLVTLANKVISGCGSGCAKPCK